MGHLDQRKVDQLSSCPVRHASSTVGSPAGAVAGPVARAAAPGSGESRGRGQAVRQRTERGVQHTAQGAGGEHVPRRKKAAGGAFYYTFVQKMQKRTRPTIINRIVSAPIAYLLPASADRRTKALVSPESNSVRYRQGTATGGAAWRNHLGRDP